MKRTLLVITAAAGSFVLSCTQSGEQKAPPVDSAKAAEAVVIADTSVATMYANYILLKDALVKADSLNARTSGNKLAANLKAVGGCEAASMRASKIGAPTATLEEQRKEFVTISSEIIPVIRQSDVKTGNIFVQFCPMANNSKGAYWLASEKEIRNPYYGDEMLSCGEVKEIVK